MHRIVIHQAEPPAPPTPAGRWHDRFEEPVQDREIEVDVGDGGVWGGVRFARQIESFVDAESGATVQIVMWRYAN